MSALERGIIEHVTNNAMATLREYLTPANPLTEEELSDLIDEVVTDTIITLSLGPAEIGEEAANALAEEVIGRISDIVKDPRFRRLYEPTTD